MSGKENAEDEIFMLRERIKVLEEQNKKLLTCVRDECKKRNRMIKVFTKLNDFFSKITENLSLHDYRWAYSIFGSSLRNIFINGLPEPKDIDIVFFIDRSHNTLSNHHFFLRLFKNIWGDKVDIKAKGRDLYLYNCPNFVSQFSITFEGIKIDMSVSDSLPSYNHFIKHIKDTTATSFSCDNKGIYFPVSNSPFSALSKILKAQNGTIEPIRIPKLVSPFLRTDLHDLRRMKKVAEVFPQIPTYPLETRIVECPVLRSDFRCIILRCGHYLSWDALFNIIKRNLESPTCPICRAKIAISCNIKDCSPIENIKSNTNLSQERITELCDAIE